jgi:hypothetical protein
MAKLSDVLLASLRPGSPAATTAPAPRSLAALYYGASGVLAASTSYVFVSVLGGLAVLVAATVVLVAGLFADRLLGRE